MAGRMRDNVPVAEFIQHTRTAFRPNVRVASTHSIAIQLNCRFVDVTLYAAIVLAAFFCSASLAIADDAAPSEKNILLTNPADFLSSAARISDQSMYKAFSESNQKTKFLSEYLHLETDSSLERDSLALIEKSSVAAM